MPHNSNPLACDLLIESDSEPSLRKLARPNQPVQLRPEQPLLRRVLTIPWLTFSLVHCAEKKLQQKHHEEISAGTLALWKRSPLVPKRDTTTAHCFLVQHWAV